jgi:hypothetical protein
LSCACLIVWNDMRMHGWGACKLQQATNTICLVRVWLYEMTCVCMDEAPASSSKLRTPFVLCVCIIVCTTCVSRDEAPVAINMLCVWLHVWHPYAWVMRLGETACYEICPHILHVWCVCVCVCRIKAYESMQTSWCILGMIKFVSWHNTGFCLCIPFGWIFSMLESIQGFWVV